MDNVNFLFFNVFLLHLDPVLEVLDAFSQKGFLLGAHRQTLLRELGRI